MAGCTEKEISDNENEPAVVEIVDENEKEKSKSTPSLFWKVENNGNTVYLLGSIHIANESFYPLDSIIEEAFDESNYLGVEADIKNVNKEEIQAFIFENAIYKDGTTIEDHLDDSTYT
jgi:uncharacterized protein YbaP (TraB family)